MSTQTPDSSEQRVITLDDQFEHCLGSYNFIIRNSTDKERSASAHRKAKQTLHKIVETAVQQASKVLLEQTKQRFHEPIEHDGSYVSISVIDKVFDDSIASLERQQHGKDKL